MKSTAEIRQNFLDFFHSKGHEIVASSSLVPHNDPTLLFTNAGMNQFKDVFLGIDKRSYTRATTAQRCVRAGGKHNDLDNVGYTARHHTFFEMLGNFSFGDYFKHDAIHFAWELLTSKEWFNLPKEKLTVTVYETDDEAYSIWQNEIGIPKERIIRIGDNKGAPYASDNFWQMGDTGPCGPCTEIFYDHGDHIWGGPPGSAEEDGDRFIEIWNIVFMQFNRHPDGTMEPLPKPSVDTGMGLERIAAVLQHVNSNYEIDLFKKLIKDTAQIIQTKDLESKSLRVIADHIRSCAFLISDGVMPSNEGRGYVLRRIIRRAVRHGHMLGAKDIFFYKLVKPLIEVMGSAATELAHNQKMVENTLKTEEEQFLKTLERGLFLLDQELGKITGSVLPGEIAFKLYDTYGFPLDLTADVCREKNITIDEDGFNKCMEEQRKRARESSAFSVDYSNVIKLDDKTEFLGYQKTEASGKVIAIFQGGHKVESINEGDEAIIVLDKTPFYGESGGQIGDKGVLTAANVEFKVIDCQKYGKSIGHIGNITKGSLKVGDTVTAAIDVELRERIRRNHSATHLLQAALQQILGKHVHQKGSLVNDSYLRFDFSHNQAITTEQLIEIENLVNQQIRRNLPVEIELMPIDQAKSKGAMALFGEKYEEIVRVLTMGDFSIELCGGTHVSRTGDIGLFKITSESSIASGVRRIEATSGQNAMEYIHYEANLLNQIGSLIKSDKSTILTRVEQLIDQTKVLEKTIEQLKAEKASQESQQLLNQCEKINNKNLLIAKLDNVEAKLLRTMIDDLKNQLKTGVIVLAAVNDGKINLAAGVTNDLLGIVKAGELVSQLALKVGGKGGGRPDFAQAGGMDLSALPEALSSVKKEISNKLQAS
ncbi:MULTISPECIES: alanine--tRNA ligase [unclassified Gilliamella]|uniref:alanine--tRNA ligase n=1 Tax=unclassified Gilliamella TaxID=2685620 RepID=UPI00226AE478|nr:MULTISPECIES: alanine--tRNA ligase [unclassified Gilliamella]MCX8642151.1 alanine--tRNA ligase [Gilliamella sp. B3835]MCX8707337.1 alanine--tRNA ligase [Gilliamella sp. B3783]MCX8710754.1 alanine--tRNA ligase [Gilliamella sp. B3780]MCX8713922.1 alanine--tRNA ligase [Gilliamella sp. B3781]MCX8716319.1 alanine--tRNA ligase [Gilliamella sp. B3784]